MPDSEILEFTELGINLHQPLIPMDRKHTPLTNCLKLQQWLMCSGSLGEPGLLEQQGKVQPSLPPSFVPAQPQQPPKHREPRVSACRPGTFAAGFFWVFCCCCSGGGVFVVWGFVSSFLKRLQTFFGFVCTFLSYSMKLLSRWQVKWIDEVVELPFLLFLNFYWYHWVTAMWDQKSQRWFSFRSGSCSLSHRALLLP